MVTYMNDKKLQSLEDVRIFLAGTLEVEFSIQGKDARYDCIEQTLRRFRYRALGRKERGLGCVTWNGSVAIRGRR